MKKGLILLIIVVAAGLTFLLSVEKPNEHQIQGNFACGEEICDVQTQYCHTSINDIANAPVKESKKCLSLPEDCKQGECECFSSLNWGPIECSNESGHTRVTFLGG